MMPLPVILSPFASLRVNFAKNLCSWCGLGDRTAEILRFAQNDRRWEVLR